MKSLLRKCAVLSALVAGPILFASWSATTGWSSSANQTWTIEVPSTITMIYSRAGASSQIYFVDQGGGYGYWTYSTSNIHVGIAGPPSGLIHEAFAQSSGGGTNYDEKWAYNYPAGQYQVYHGGGSSHPTASVFGYSEINW